MTPMPAIAHLSPAWFSIVMGLCGLSLAWHRAIPALGAPARALAWAGGLAALLVFGLLALASLWRWLHHRPAVLDDLRHPVRHAFFAAVPVSMLLLPTVGLALFGPDSAAVPALRALWWAAAQPG